MILSIGDGACVMKRRYFMFLARAGHGQIKLIFKSLALLLFFFTMVTGTLWPGSLWHRVTAEAQEKRSYSDEELWNAYRSICGGVPAGVKDTVLRVDNCSLFNLQAQAQERILFFGMSCLDSSSKTSHPCRLYARGFVFGMLASLATNPVLHSIPLPKFRLWLIHNIENPSFNKQHSLTLRPMEDPSLFWPSSFPLDNSFFEPINSFLVQRDAHAGSPVGLYLTLHEDSDPREGYKTQPSLRATGNKGVLTSFLVAAREFERDEAQANGFPSSSLSDNSVNLIEAWLADPQVRSFEFVWSDYHMFQQQVCRQVLAGYYNAKIPGFNNFDQGICRSEIAQNTP